MLNIPFLPNITGLGSAVENEGILQKMLIKFYQIAYKKASCVFFQNEENYNFFVEKNIKIKNHQIIPGSGVNIDFFKTQEYPSDDLIEFVFISRIMKEKGIDQYIDAAKNIRKRYPQTRFHVLGFCEEEYEDELKRLEDEDIIKYIGMQSDVIVFIKKSHCMIHPSYYLICMSDVL